MRLCVWLSGFFASAAVALGFALLLPTASGAETESGDILNWGYITPASKHTKGRVDPVQVSNASSRPLPIGKLLDKPGNRRAGFPREEDISKFNSDSVSGPEFYLRRTAGSSVLFSILPNMKRRKVTWRFLNHEYELVILEHMSYSNIVSFNSYFRHRVKYDLKTGSLLVKKLQVEDSGLFEVKVNELLFSNSVKFKYFHFHLEVQAQLKTPLIVQSPAYVFDRVQLSCVVLTGKVTGIQWLKDGVPIHNYSHYKMALDCSTLFIEDLRTTDCGLYTCSINNDVSKAQISHFLIANGVLSIVFYAFLMSVVAVVSNVTSFITTTMIIFVVLRNTQVEKYRREFITIFVTLQLISFICLLIASLFCVYISGFTTVFRIIAAFGGVFSVTMIIYFTVLFLNLEIEESSTFISNNYHCCVMYLLGFISVLLPSLLLYKSAQIAIQCRYSNELLTIRGILAGLTYLFPVLVFALLYSMHILLELEPQVKLKRVRRAR